MKIEGQGHHIFTFNLIFPDQFAMPMGPAFSEQYFIIFYNMQRDFHCHVEAMMRVISTSLCIVRFILNTL